MLFNSLEYFAFLPLVFLLYYLIPVKFRWVLLLSASYYFYMCWRAEYIVLIMLCTLVDYSAGRLMEGSGNNKQRKKLYLFSALTINLGLLFFFKYYNFFTSSVSNSLHCFNIKVAFPDFDILLPVGISFFTFQSLSYTIDVYRGNTKAEKHLGYYALYVSFFPQMIAGPIERATHLIPQLKKDHVFSYQLASLGIKSIALGLFKKVVIADRLSIYTTVVFDHPGDFHGIPVLLAFFFFAIQIYCDFSGYSDIAIGSARLLGINLRQNFNAPYFSSSFKEFWQRWHISLSSWFRDYVYIPLGGSRVAEWRHYFNLFIVFFISGLWHGANWTFVVWGSLHGLFMIIEERFNTGVIYTNETTKKFPLLKVALTTAVICLTWVFFRAASIHDALQLFKSAFFINGNQLRLNEFRKLSSTIELLLSFLFIASLFAIDYVQYRYGNARIVLSKFSFLKRQVFYLFCIFIILAFGIFGKNQFIYFQF